MMTSVNFWLFIVKNSLIFLKPTTFHSFFYHQVAKNCHSKEPTFIFEVTCVSFVILDFFNKFYLLCQVGFFFSSFVKQVCGQAFRKGPCQLWLHVKEGTQFFFKTLYVLGTNHMGKPNMVNLEKNQSHLGEFFWDPPPLNHVEPSQPFFFVAEW